MRLEDYAKPAGGGRWWFSRPDVTHDETTALAIVEACQLLGVPITDVVSARAYLRLVDTVVRLNERVDKLEERLKGSHYLPNPYKGD